MSKTFFLVLFFAAVIMLFGANTAFAAQCQCSYSDPGVYSFNYWGNTMLREPWEQTSNPACMDTCCPDNTAGNSFSPATVCGPSGHQECCRNADSTCYLHPNAQGETKGDCCDNETQHLTNNFSGGGQTCCNNSQDYYSNSGGNFCCSKVNGDPNGASRVYGEPGNQVCGCSVGRDCVTSAQVTDGFVCSGASCAKGPYSVNNGTGMQTDTYTCNSGVCSFSTYIEPVVGDLCIVDSDCPIGYTIACDEITGNMQNLKKRQYKCVTGHCTLQSAPFGQCTLSVPATPANPETEEDWTDAAGNPYYYCDGQKRVMQRKIAQVCEAEVYAQPGAGGCPVGGDWFTVAEGTIWSEQGHAVGSCYKPADCNGEKTVDRQIKECATTTVAGPKTCNGDLLQQEISGGQYCSLVMAGGNRLHTVEPECKAKDSKLVTLQDCGGSIFATNKPYLRCAGSIIQRKMNRSSCQALFGAEPSCVIDEMSFYFIDAINCGTPQNVSAQYCSKGILWEMKVVYPGQCFYFPPGSDIVGGCLAPTVAVTPIGICAGGNDGEGGDGGGGGGGPGMAGGNGYNNGNSTGNQTPGAPGTGNSTPTSGPGSPPPTGCTPTSVTVGSWSACSLIGGKYQQTRAVSDNCGTSRVETQSCAATCTPAFSCGAWSACTGGTQSRVCTDLNSCFPPRIETQPCTAACTPAWWCSNWSSCDANGQRTRECTDVNGCNVDGPPEISSCDNPPFADTLNVYVPAQAYCNGVAGLSIAYFQWNYRDSDPDSVNENEQRFILQIDNNSDFSSPEVIRSVTNPVCNGGECAPGAENRQLISILPNATTPDGNYLTYNTNYYWRVGVQEKSTGYWSDWIYYRKTDGTLKTYRYGILHPAPYVMYNVTFGNSATEKIVYFADSSICWDSNLVGGSCKNMANSYLWDFGDGTTSASKTDREHSYPLPSPENPATYSTSLMVCDELGQCCIDGKNIDVKTKKAEDLPQWKEVSPF